MALPGVRPATGWLFVAPFCAVFAVFILWPLGYNAWLALHDYFLQTGHTQWNGFANFVMLTWPEREFGPALKNSLIFLVLVPMLQIAGLGLALLLHRPFPGAGLIRALCYVPVIIAMSIAAVVWRQAFAADGLVNSFLATFGIISAQNPPLWFSRENLALYPVILFAFWKNLGFYMVLYLAGLQSVPREQHEAAILDGANRFERLRHVTLPALQPVILLCTLLATIYALKAMQEPLYLTRGSAHTTTALLYVWNAAFYGHQFGYAAAAGLIVTVICLMLALFQFRLLGEHGRLRQGNAT
ncbi:carbohydrate ABC transporter permease [Silvimonas amylolytica]|uniref:Sugar ABC transporter permease n=1 Tax=Silvimonas amylolytica TaxID=449663 RepID=A0ABQ2PMG2_9NEIS|nr:sugar ABC transporter permease [Silvimonas amylolytica]GGP26591.1 sugar ABC transporter permease [Silvimonas amylolytica]